MLAALRADCDAGNLAQDPYLHTGCFREASARRPGEYYYDNYIYMYFDGDLWSWSVRIFPECTNTIRWLQDRGLMDEEILPGRLPY